jgi:D-alanyl-D-alanine-carboxypeptidase/D-alanyl-D-alanine-endopeptidase
MSNMSGMQVPYASFEPELPSAAGDWVGRFGGVGLAVGALVGEARAVVGVGVDPGALFEIGSISKAFTGLALADMAVKGEVALDAPARELLPEAVHWPAAVGREITLADLASHSSGLPSGPPGLMREALRHWRDPYARFGVDVLYEALADTRLKRAPGERFRYSNFGFALLGHALARTAGGSWEELVTTRVCAPLGLDDTHASVPAEKLSRLAAGHTRRGGEVPAWTMPEGIAAAGALRSTAGDLLAFLRAHLEPGSTALGRAIELARRPRKRISRRAAVGLGWLMLAPRRGPRIVWHSGGTGGFRAYAGLAPDRGRTAVVTLSSSRRAPDRLGERLLKRLDA